jgi:hypothetical protein
MTARDRLPAVVLPRDLDDDTVAALHTFFLDAAAIIETHYAAQLLRHRHRPDPAQHALWNDDPPF